MNIQMIGIDEDAFQAAREEERISWGKANTTAGFGLCEGAMGWLRDRWVGVLWRNGNDTSWCRLCSRDGAIPDGYVYRLSPDYQIPPVKRFWFNTITQQVYQTAYEPSSRVEGVIEVTADYAAYLSERPDGDWELRVPELGDTIFDEYYDSRETLSDFGDLGLDDRGYRWCKPKPVKRWWFNTDTKKVNHSVFSMAHDIEVTADYAAYLSEKPDGEWELRFVKEGDVILDFHKRWVKAEWDYSDNGPDDRGYRWCKPRPTMRWVEYEVTVVDYSKWKSYTVQIEGVELDLTQASCIVGFGGVQFDGFDEWSMLTTMFARKYDGCLSFIYSDTTDRPAVPIRARFWQEVK